MTDLASLAFEDVLPATLSSDLDSSSAELDLEQEDPPLLRFSWRPVYSFYGISPTVAVAWQNAGFAVEPTKECGLCLRVSPKELRVITFCNFRRYAWSWTEDPTAEQGYAFGVCYANDELPIHPLATSPELVIRDSLIASWERLKAAEARNGFVSLFDTRPVHGLLERLYADAVKHRTRFSTPAQNRRTYTFHAPKVVGIKSASTWVEVPRTC